MSANQTPQRRSLATAYRKLRDENAELLHDNKRFVQTATELATELEEMRAQNADLLAALSAALQSMDARNDDTGLDVVRQIARAAIAKATGAQS